MSEKIETGWLVEKGDPSAPRYLMLNDDGIFGWTAEGDHAAALRLARRDDAEKIVSAFFIEDADRICFHEWA